jgi:hypothetical protein
MYKTSESTRRAAKKYYRANRVSIITKNSARQKTMTSKKKPIILGGKAFNTKKAMKTHFQTILKNLSEGDILEGDELKQFKDLAARHPRYRDGAPKINGVQIGKIMGTLCFTLLLDSGPEVISYNKCINAKPFDKYIRQRVQRSARLAIMPQIRRFRETAPLICEISGDECNREDLHVDHDFSKGVTFQSLLDAWLKEQNYSYADIILELDPILELDVMARDFRRSWYTYHQDYASLRMIKKSLNLSGKCI